MTEIVELKLSRDFVDQILDCLRIAADDWHRTMRYLEEGYINPDEPCIRECSSAHEARQIEKYYRKIIAEIETQLSSH